MEKGRKRRLGGTPLSTPDGRPIFSLYENRRVRYLLNRRPYNKGGRGPRGSIGLELKKRPQPQKPWPQPFFIWEGLGVRLAAGFPKKESRQATRGSKDSPLARLCLLSSCEERRWPSGQTWKNGLSVCPRKKNAILLKRRSNARPRPFSSWRKDARTLRGTPKHPRWSADFLFMKIGGYGIS